MSQTGRVRGEAGERVKNWWCHFGESSSCKIQGTNFKESQGHNTTGNGKEGGFLQAGGTKTRSDELFPRPTSSGKTGVQAFIAHTAKDEVILPMGEEMADDIRRHQVQDGIQSRKKPK